ncbi:MAG: twin-arginine translocation signal domain-containing protein, partial [Rhodospirillales bacterium]
MATKKTKVSRRKFLKTGAVAAGAGAATLAMPNVSRAQTTTLKMQSSWGATSPFQDMAKQYVERVQAMAGGR